MNTIFSLEPHELAPEYTVNLSHSASHTHHEAVNLNVVFYMYHYFYDAGKLTNNNGKQSI